MTGRAGQLVIHAVIVSLGSGTATGASANNHCRSNTHLDSRKRRARSHRLDRVTTTKIITTWCKRGGERGVNEGRREYQKEWKGESEGGYCGLEGLKGTIKGAEG